MADFDGIIDPAADWADVPSLSVACVALAGPGGAMNAQAEAIMKRFKYLETVDGSKKSGWEQAGADAILRSVSDKLQEIEISPTDYVLTTSGSDYLPAINKAIAALPATGGRIRLPGGRVYGIAGTITTSDSKPILIFGDGESTVVKKLSNGDMFNLGKQSTLRDFAVDGNGATYTGRGVIMSNGAVDHVSWRLIHRVNIRDMESYPIEYTAAVAGYNAIIEHCVLESLNGALSAVKYPASESNGNRLQLYCRTSGPVAETAGCNNLLIMGCDGAPPVMTSSSVKVRIIGNRFPFSAPSPTFTVDGVDTTCIGNVIGSSAIVFSSGMSNCVYRSNADTGPAPTITDSANGTNFIEIKQRLGTPAWTATGTAPTIGNGTLSSSYSRRGNMCKFDFSLILGTTSTMTGTTWQLSLPYTVGRNGIGSAHVQQGAAFYPGVAYAISGFALMQFAVSGNTLPIGTASPAAWTAASNNRIDGSVEFQIA